MKSIRYVLPGFLNYSTNETLIKIYEKYPHIAKEDSMIYSFFGTFPNTIWNGGRPDIVGKHFNRSKMKKIRDFYNKRKIAITFTFTNPLIKEQHLNDEYCNEILKVFNNGKNEIMINSPILENYIRNKYKNYRYNQSITKENVIYDLNNFNIAVIKKDKNKDFEYLNKLSVREREKIELLCNEMCINDCKYTFIHYNEMANIQLGTRKICDKGNYGICKHGGEIPLEKAFWWLKNKSKYFIDPNDVSEIYSPMGFRYFKLQGREKYNVFGFCSIIHYCIKPKYQEDVITYIFERTLLEFEYENNELIKMRSAHD